VSHPLAWVKVRSALAAFCVCFSAALYAHAEGGLRVFLIKPDQAAPEAAVAMVRVQGELVADGFDVVTVDAAAPTSARAMNQAGDPMSITVGLFMSADGNSAELWVVDRLTNKTLIRPVSEVDSSHRLTPNLLALKAVELVRASLLELTIARSTQAPTRASVVRASNWAAQSPPPRSPIWAVESGGAVLWNPSQLEPTLQLALRARLRLTPRTQLRVSFIGLGTRAPVHRESGSATVAEWQSTAEAVFLPWRESAVSPVISLGLGVLHTSVKATANAPYQGRARASLALSPDLGTGLVFMFSSRLALTTEAHVFMAFPKPIVSFAGQDVVRVADPGLAGVVTLLGWF
jgi:hypothetical protein